ncbi:hypothetical protein SKAU_G00067990 [Synaphobranchus kaupii]|uniref:Fibronectin type-III domain-containing protein n=1 Tax=Synaphobranchus kaupii TaxID=118154 RepID=A0A9Q1G664_SYNKA|nr:hypothetical protein SKAU_G00067990 [Synaphobranchus kaupii]
MQVFCSGVVQVEPGAVVHMGSELTILCRSYAEHCGRHFSIYLNRQLQDPLEVINCSTVRLRLANIVPNAELICTVSRDKIQQTVCGTVLQPGFIPNTPKIVMVEFGNSSQRATLHWTISESSGLWRTKVRMGDTRRHTEFWGTDLRQGLVSLDGLRPLSWYEFQIQACSIGDKPMCSQWSKPVQYTSPGTAPTKKLDVWRILRGIQENGTQSVTVLWKHLRPEDYRDVMVGHELVYQEQGQRQVVTCGANVTEKTLHVSPDVTRIFICAVTSTGKSPPATLHISHAEGLTMPCLRDVAPAGESSVRLAWDVYHHENQSALGYVVQWQSHSQQIQWKRLAANTSLSHIEGLEPGVRFNMSLYAITSMGISDPAFCQAYSREEKPLSGPKVSLLNIEATRILIQWEELGLGQQRGFITNYTVYMKKHNTGQQLILAGSMFRQMWLNHLDTPFDLHISASNSAGEGPLGDGVFCQLQGSPKDWSNVVFGLVIAVPLVVLANLMCWNCVRRRITTMCTMVLPQWLYENFPKVENSTATKLLQDKERSDSESSWRFVYDDHPITSVEIIPAERTDWHPSTMGIKSADVGMGGWVLPEKPESSPLLEEEHAYKPQITSAAPEDFPEEEDNPWVTPLHTGVTLISGDEDTMYSPHVSGLLREWLSDITQDGSGTGLNTTGGIHFKGTPQLVLTAGSWLEEGLRELRDRPEDIHLGQTLLPDQLVSCLRSPAIEPSPTTFPRELSSVSHNTTTEECM